MKTTTNPCATKDQPATLEQPKLNHTEKIKSQVLARIGKPTRLHRVEVCNHHNGKYRVNIWEQPEPAKNVAVTASARIRSSYYLKVSDTGEIIESNPPMAKLDCPD
jgi:hypothetical protein